MKKLKTFRANTQMGGGDLNIFTKSERDYLATYHGLSGYAHEKKHGEETPLAANIDFELEDTSYDNLIEKCRAKIEKCDSKILTFCECR